MNPDAGAAPAPEAEAPAYLVAVEAPLEGLTYLPPEDGTRLTRGQSVRVPLGKRVAHGVILKSIAKPPPGEYALKAIAEPDPERPLLPGPYVDWLEWLAQYYCYPLGHVVETVFPPLPRESKRGGRKGPVVKETLALYPAPQLTPDQTRVIGDIEKEKGFAVHLLHGVTGSGKTEVYLQLLEDVLRAGKQALVLVPEISLTPQLIDRFSRRFPGMVAVLHSHLTPREKTDQWWSMVSGQRKILIGARSALFCPLPDPGIVILDEEHEPSYKQDEKLKYHARDAAVVLAKMLNVPLVLGSATPSLESWNNAVTGRYKLHTMAERVNARPLPEIAVVDLREQKSERKDKPSELPHWLSETLHQELHAVFAKKEQAALFLNRRGIAQAAHCRGCGFSPECPNCSVSLTVHVRHHLVCHFCDYTEKLAEMCPNCRDGTLEPLGLGTEKIETDMATLFPGLRIARADRDEVQTREELEELIRKVEDEEVDLLVGTQMIAKGLDFPKLNLVGLVLADVGFHWPDFRASERSFQLLTQVSGRSGRQSAGKVVIQTYDPEHASIRYTVAGDFKGFADQEMTERREMNYPPAWRMAMLRIQGGDPVTAKEAAKRVAQRAQQLMKQSPTYAEGMFILGPAPAPLFKLRGQYRYQVMLKCDSANRLGAFCRQLMTPNTWLPPKTKVQIDIDPFQML